MTKNLIICLSLILILSQCKKNQETQVPPQASTQQSVAANTVTPKGVIEGQNTQGQEEESPPNPANINQSPLEAIKELDRKIDHYKTGSQLTEQEVEANRKLKLDILRGTFDIRELCKLSLAEHWNEISPQEHDNFTNLMMNLLERKAIFSKEQVKGEGKPYQITYKSQKFLDDQKSKALVNTQIHVPSQKATITINYQLRQDPTGWRVFDVIVDEASLVENYKFQFDTIIKKYGYQELINRMQNKLKQME